MSCLPCPPTECDPVFDRVVVSRVTAGGTTVAWQLLPGFPDPNPLTFRLEAATDGAAGPFAPVGPPVTDAYYAVDPAQHDWGTVARTFYRVRLATARGEYVSPPVHALGALDRRDWLLARQLVRERTQELRLREGSPGYLLKRRHGGERCPTCADFQTGDPTRADCPDCYGTGFRCGYYYPQGCVWAGLYGGERFPRPGANGRPPEDPTRLTAELVLTELVDTDDVWVHARTDDRYWVRQVAAKVRLRGVPLYGTAGLVPVPFSSPVYRLPVPSRPAPGPEAAAGLIGANDAPF